MELSKRLKAVADLVSRGRNVADIGCDHGYVSIYLCEKQIAEKVIAMDVNDGPLARAREHIRQAGLSRYIETRLSDGADALGAKEADSAVIAGMGGRLMVRILSQAAARIGNFEELVLQPQSEIFKVREYLWENGYQIVAEDMVLEDGKYYQMIKALKQGKTAKDAHGTDVCKEFEKIAEKTGVSAGQVREACAWYGPLLLKTGHTVCREYRAREYRNLDRIRQHITEQKATSETIERVEELSYKLEILQVAEKVGNVYGDSQN
ncbi:MAG: SAM-dependent methyltransferase [Lachnospiraceae bacterium]|jgi:tRNA (adenine22-N1)-methyltransferase|nr:SAM-dependent methyltransferase [Lachnospiraceae bacterium]